MHILLFQWQGLSPNLGGYISQDQAVRLYTTWPYHGSPTFVQTGTYEYDVWMWAQWYAWDIGVHGLANGFGPHVYPTWFLEATTSDLWTWVQQYFFWGHHHRRVCGRVEASPLGTWGNLL